MSVLWLGELIALGLALLSVPSVLLERKSRPLAATVWLLSFLFVPFIGVTLWWLIGRMYMSRRRRRRKNARAHVVARLTRVRDLMPRRSVTGPHPAIAAASARQQAESLVFTESDRVFPSRKGNRVRVLVDAVEVYPAMLAAIAAARHHINFQFYIYQPDETGRRFRDALIERALAGVKVRVLVDAVGGGDAAGSFMDPLREAGGQVSMFLPLRFLRRRLSINFRNHRKILVVDGRAAFTGGLNIGDEYTQGWHDLGLQLEGPVIDQLQEVFAEDWFFACRESLASEEYFGAFETKGPLDLPTPGPVEAATRARIIASGPDTQKNPMFQIFFLACTTATLRIWIMTPYFIPDQAMQVALISAAERGVDVRLLVPQRSDVPFVQMACRSYYEDLLQGGVHIFEYTPAILHAKMLIFDHDWAMLGSANVDIRSFRLNFEANCFMEGEAINTELAAIFSHDLEQSVPIRTEDIRRVGRIQRYAQAAAHLFSPLL